MKRLVLALTLLFASANLLAAPLIEQLNRLIDAGQMQQAYDQARLHQDERAGTPAFDLPFGIAAIDSGHINEGVFALERVLFLQPTNHRARLEYARGLFILGEDAQAKQAFTQVLAQADPPPSVREKIDQFLDAIRRRESRYNTTAQGYVGLGYGYDSNLNSAPDTQPTGALLPISVTLDRGDQFTKLLFGGQLYHPVSTSNKLYGRWDSTLRIYNHEADQDNANHSLTLGSQWNRARYQFDLSLNAQHYRLDDQGYRNLFGPTLQWSSALRPDLSLQAGFSWLALNYPDNPFRDGRQGVLNLRLFGNLDAPLSPSWLAGAFYGDERSDEQSSASRASVDRNFYGGQLGGQISLRPSLSLIGMAVFQRSDYAADYALYGVTRNDRYYALDLELKQLLNRHLQLSLNLNYSDNHSNIDLYQYRRTQAGLTLRYDF